MRHTILVNSRRSKQNSTPPCCPNPTTFCPSLPLNRRNVELHTPTPFPGRLTAWRGWRPMTYPGRQWSPVHTPFSMHSCLYTRHLIVRYQRVSFEVFAVYCAVVAKVPVSKADVSVCRFRRTVSCVTSVKSFYNPVTPK